VDDVGSVADEIVAAGGTTVGERMQVDVSGMGQLLFQYVADPEGNIIELQKWS
jgi:predicted enzyme related to lactoylglutathione lyase